MNDEANNNTIERLLINGQPPATPVQVQRALDDLGIKHSSISHAPMRTVADSRALREGVPGGYSKNLFLRNRKGKMLLVTLLEHRTVNLKALGEMLGLGKPSFASPQRLMQYLGVIPGAVTPLAVLNDVTRSVSVVLDQQLLSMDPLHFHPCDNSMTTTVSSVDLMRYIEHYHEAPAIVDFDALEGVPSDTA